MCLEVFDDESAPTQGLDGSHSALLIYAAISWPGHLQTLLEVGFDLHQIERLSTKLDAFLVQQPPSPAFVSWSTTFEHAGINAGSGYLVFIQSLCTHPISNAFASLVFDYSWKQIPLCEYRKLRTIVAWTHSCVEDSYGGNYKVNGLAFAATMRQSQCHSVAGVRRHTSK